MKIRISQEVAYALANNLPVVALESTIIAHGMPYPQNVEIALKVEEIIRTNGALPATIAIIGGDIVVGLDEDEIEELGQREGVLKVSRRDLAYAMATKQWGATTVAATMVIAAKVGIKVFVTGGVGGVHRGAEDTFDISSDLEELARTNIAVVCAGPKAILDVEKTLEYLETKGVPVLGYKTDKMPIFYTSSPSLKVLYRVDSAAELAQIVNASHALDLQSGILVVNPIPEKDALPYKDVEKVIEEAITEMEKEGIRGKEQTPYLLTKINELTKGKSQIANEALIVNNAKLGAMIAKNISRELYED
ncbi:MAG: Pseudouridine-5'-phosphate glycosidase [Tenericutes bacterium ADurb.Bin239]|jgi:pseudouridine-5'-phosphate glycosidase|nr:MAG: Pseudouridine-5'-phosphate glycosidase [Tenericutes bacterium ADurb.Bin239]